MTSHGMSGLPAGTTEPEGGSVAAATAMPQGHCLAVRGDADSALICLGADLNLHFGSPKLHLYLAAFLIIQ